MKKRTLKNQISKAVKITVASGLLLQNAFGQFEKYESKTTFDSAPDIPPTMMPEPPTQFTPDAEFDDDSEDFGGGFADEGGGGNGGKSFKDKMNGGKPDMFGRSATPRPQAPEAKKYVNLNPETAFGPEVITSFDFPNIQILDLTKHMQKLTGINLILDKDVKGTISIMAPSPITVGDAWKAYLTALNLNGYSLVKSGAFYKVVSNRDITYVPTKIYTGAFTPDTENYVMKIIPLKNIKATELSRSFRPFMSRYGRIIELKDSNTVLIQETGNNITRLEKLIKFIDIPGKEQSLQIFPVKYSSAQEISKLLDNILRSKGGTSGGGVPGAASSHNIPKIIAENRTNSIIALANADEARELKELITKLDVKAPASGSGQIHVYYLSYSDSETLSKTLSELVSSSKSARVPFSPTAQSNDGNSLFNAEVRITADKGNNALVVTASPTDYLTIKQVIKKLDVPRDQVYVEGLIMETETSKGKGWGVSVIGALGTGAAQKAGFGDSESNASLMNVISNNITSLGGLFVGGGTGGKVKLGDKEVNTVNGLITAIATNSATNVLATPQILALDNTEAVFEVGEKVPVSEQTQGANGSSAFSTKMQDVTLKLKITPQINKTSRMIKLKIDQNIQDFSKRKLEGATQGVPVVSRQTATTVIVRDRDTIAMGGLMRDKSIETESKVPLLGDIPVLGWLFKSTRTDVTKANLLFFMTPRILDKYAQANSENVMDLLNRRNTHLKGTQEDGDPFQTTAKGLFEKAKKQGEGPLFDQAKLDVNNDESIGRKDNEENVIDLTNPATPIVPNKPEEKTPAPVAPVSPVTPSAKVKTPSNLETPDYSKIVDEIKTKAAGIKK